MVSISGHVATTHRIISLDKNCALPANVNSFHQWSIPSEGLGEGLVPLATDSSGNIEAFVHKASQIKGIAWHPERNHPFHELDLALFTRMFHD